MEQKDILAYFYNEKIINTLFGDQIIKTKEDKAIEKSAFLYRERLNKLFKFISQPYVLKNTSNSTMFHFLMASNNKAAVKIADDIVTKYNKLN